MAIQSDEFSVAIVGKRQPYLPSSALLSPPSNFPSPTDTSPLGAGVAGLALAMGLARKGVPFTIYEEAKEYSVVG